MEQKDVELRLESMGIRCRMKNREYEEEFLRVRKDCKYREDAFYFDKHFCKKAYTCSLLACPFVKGC